MAAISIFETQKRRKPPLIRSDAFANFCIFKACVGFYRGEGDFILLIEQVTMLRIILLNLQMLKMILIDLFYLLGGLGWLQISQIV